MYTDILPGQSYPLGATVYPDGVNFALFSQHAAAVELLLFATHDLTRPACIIPLDPKINKTFYYWHIFVKGIDSGQVYGYRVYGPYAPERGYRYDGKKVLLDPYTRAIVGKDIYDRHAAAAPGDNCATALKSVVVNTQAYDWQDDKRPTNNTNLVIYEMHIGGFTRHPSSGLPPEKRGTYAGLISKIPYLQQLGITAVELLPVHEFDEQDAQGGLPNYWGYSPIAFFAPHSGYSSRRDPLGPVDEFRDMVKALHQAGIKVILDVVFNHTAEVDEKGPLLSFRGLENEGYYILDPANRGRYLNYSGCGNTFNANHSIVRRLILQCLQYWVTEMHVDGFRFDLASTMSRGEFGEPLSSPPILWSIESDPILAGADMIAEAWDAGGLYQVGTFIGDRFMEWNGQYRDDVRRFIKSDPGMTKRLTMRLLSSPDIYPHLERHTKRSVHFVTCHDGFTLNDLVAYNEKHNLANREGNNDGHNDNCSWNCGIEGPTNDRDIEALRLRQIKNLLTILFVSQGTPMILMGDEVRRTQQGNNNAYCQNNELSWFDWQLLDTNAGLLRFTQGLIQFHQTHNIFHQIQYLSSYREWGEPYVEWHGIYLHQPDWSWESRSLAFTLRHTLRDEFLHVILNTYWEPLTFELPPLPQHEGWHRVVDTFLPSPDDYTPPAAAALHPSFTYTAQPRSTIILVARAILA
ncbi:MAG: glycogen debranching protein GlgX [Chloroflexi bacterium]|nr:glycogen debranching protein GlgX [Chloroflexota bacterium]MBP8057073.1 glycogen debranching protein GlgX [Chloroflexota bacterium]